MSASLLKADIGAGLRHVRFGPNSEVFGLVRDGGLTLGGIAIVGLH